MKWMRVLIAALALALGAFFVYWWMEIRLLPTVRISHTIGKGNRIDLDWIEIN
ncbi:MAG TPA: hypothetical protein VKY39_06225 [Aggregatilineales bacterium]|nr:hypothetical protein [Aggregatilineales bacterium]